MYDTIETMITKHFNVWPSIRIDVGGEEFEVRYVENRIVNEFVIYKILPRKFFKRVYQVSIMDIFTDFFMEKSGITVNKESKDYLVQACRFVLLDWLKNEDKKKHEAAVYKRQKNYLKGYDNEKKN